MKKLKWIITFLIVSLVIGVIGCKDPEVEHQHQFTKKWEIDEYYHWKKCNCGEIDFESEHSFDDWKVIKAATEKAEGKQERKCTVCPYTATQVIEKLAHTHKFATDWTKDKTNHWYAATCGHDVTDSKATHTFGEWQVTKEASCIENGERKATCTVCDFEKTEVSGKAAHSFGDWTVTKAATEEAEGTKERSCSVCGYTATEVIEKLAHTHKFATDWTKDETNHWYAATCGHTTEVSGKAEHTLGEYVSNNDATTEKDGTKTRECSVCGYKDTVTDEGSKIHVHTFAEEWTIDSSGHWHAATCGHTTEVSGKAEHTFGEYVSNNDATTEKDGTKTRECSVCGYKDTVTDEGSKIHVHTFAEEWTIDSSGHWHEATCGHSTEVSGKAAHSFGDWTVTKAATEEAKGSKERVCTVCNYKEVVDIAKILEDFVLIPAGIFQMGTNDSDSYSRPVHQVTITKSFYMGKYEVTQEEWESVMGSNPSFFQGEERLPAEGEVQGKRPVERISWYETLVYCNKRSVAEGLTPCYSISGNTDTRKWGTVPTSFDSTWNAVVCDWNANGYRLPTEAEWEYAARAGDNTVDSFTYSGTSDIDKLVKYAWIQSRSNDATHEVGTKLQNAFGLYDMSGNVREWCWNWFKQVYDTGKDGGSDPTGATSGDGRVFRGGSWDAFAVYCAVSYRKYGHSPYFRDYELGFRVVRASSK